MKRQLQLSDLPSVNEVLFYQAGTFTIKCSEEEMFRPGFYFCIDETGSLALYTISRLHVTERNKSSQGLNQIIRRILNADYYKNSVMVRLKNTSRFAVYYVSVEDIKYLTNAINYKNTLRGAFLRTKTSKYNNMNELSRDIKRNFVFKYQK